MPLNSEILLDSSQPRRQDLRASLPAQLADHELLRPIASGSYGDVWLGRNQLTGTYRAVKIVWRDAFDTPKPYEREFEAIRRFEPISRTHPGLVQVLHTGKLPNGFYYIMELADDLEKDRPFDAARYKPATLAALQRQGIAVDRAIRIGIALTECLEVLHSAGLIHRDIKPSNVIFVRGAPKLADIGLVVEASAANSIVGTNGFIAPEGPTTVRADIYSLGKLLYEIATGLDRLEFPKLPEEVTLNESLLLEFNQILLKACDPDPARRYGSVSALRDELELLIQGRSVRRVRQLENAVRRMRASLATICISVVAGYFLLESRQAQRTAAMQALERRVGSAVAQGNERANAGDYLGAIQYFTQGALLDGNNSEHRFRIGSALEYAPKVVSRFGSDSQLAYYAMDSKLLATKVRGAIRLTDIQSRQVVREVARKADDFAIDREGRSLAMFWNNTNSLLLLDLISGAEESLLFPSPVWHMSVISPLHYAVTLTDGTAWLFPGRRQLKSRSGAEISRTFLSPSGRMLCVLERGGQFSVLDAETLENRFDGRHQSELYDVAFLRNESEVITCSFDYTAQAWEINTGKRKGLPMEHEDGVMSVAVSPDESRVATASLDRTVKIWTATEFSPVRENHILYHPERVEWVYFVSNSSVLTHCSDGSSWLWEIDWDRDLKVEEPRSFDLPPRDRLVGPKIDLHGLGNCVTGEIGGKAFSVTLPGPVETIAADPAAQLIAIGTGDSGRARHSVRLFDRHGVLQEQPLAHKDGINYVTFSHSGELIGTGSEDFTARIWDRKGVPVTPPLRHRGQVRWLSFSDNDEWVATASWDKTVRVWNARNGTPVTVSLKVNNIVDYVCFHGEDELFLANSKRNYSLKVPFFDGDIRSLLSTLPGPIDGEQF
jgi:WD40 repeat protein